MLRIEKGPILQLELDVEVGLPEKFWSEKAAAVAVLES
jgi:hypothetical protein